MLYPYPTLPIAIPTHAPFSSLPLSPPMRPMRRGCLELGGGVGREARAAVLLGAVGRVLMNLVARGRVTAPSTTGGVVGRMIGAAACCSSRPGARSLCASTAGGVAGRATEGPRPLLPDGRPHPKRMGMELPQRSPRFPWSHRRVQA
jgi:hypothetical protein